MKYILTLALALSLSLSATAATSTIEALTDATTISASDKVWMVDVDGTPADVDATLEQIVSPFAADPSSNSAFDAAEWAADLNITSAWGDITSTPTTLSGYGITDAATFSQGALADSALQSVAFGDIASTPTTLSGYGITDAATFAQGALADSALQSVAFGDITSTPTTLLGYGITDAATFAQGALAATALQIGEAQTVITDTDTAPPTSGAVVDYVAQQIPVISGLGDVYVAQSNNQVYVTTLAGFDADAQAYITATGLTGAAAFVIDDTVRMLKGQSDSTSLRGSTWSILSANRWTNLKGAYLMQSADNHGAGTVLEDLTQNMDLTVVGGTAWNASGFSFDGNNDIMEGTGPLVTSGQWSMLWVGSGSAGSVSGQNNSGNFRTTFLSAGATGGIFKRVDPTSYSSADLTTSTVTLNSFLSVQTATDLEVYAAGVETLEGTEALAATTIESSAFTLGGVIAGGYGSFLTGTMKLTLLWNEDVSSDYAEIHANLNSLLSLGL